MIYSIGATAVAILHFAFILFVAFGGLLVLRWHRLAWIHLPAAVWGAVIELKHWNCPLTNVELWLLRRAGKQGYEGGFVAHYLFAMIYPAGLTRGKEIAIGVVVLVINSIVYYIVLPPHKLLAVGSWLFGPRSKSQ
ncbi:MAG: DUF2784 domain-containing protein [Thermoanaerobaculia bacterium]